jgi:DNA polymerase III epsilon subunit family exonuclease
MLENYCVVDLETTGLSRYYNKITEIGAIKVSENKVVGKYQKLVNPETQIPEFITRLTGIDDSLVKNEKTINEVLPSFLEFVGDDIIVGHNISFDIGFLNYNLYKHLNTYLDNNKLCTIKLSKRLVPDLASRKLTALCDYFQVPHFNAHRALSDVLATNHIFSKMNAIMHNSGIKEKEDILKFQKSPIPKIDYFSGKAQA